MIKRNKFGYIPFDQATSKIRGLFGLLKIADKCYGKEVCSDILKILTDSINKGDSNR